MACQFAAGGGHVDVLQILSDWGEKVKLHTDCLIIFFSTGADLMF